MKVTIDFTKSAQENADLFYKKSKKLILKKAGAEHAIKDLEKKMKNIAETAKKPEKKKVVLAEKEWYEKFHWFFTSDGTLVIGGRDAHQNELLNSKHFDEKDLFFHANIFGASVTILKNGTSASKEAMEETAQMAACYSSAWKEGLHTVDVYAMRRDQVSKSTGKGSIGTGSFLLSGERQWYRNVSLSLIFFLKEAKINATPEITFYRMKEKGIALGAHTRVQQGSMKKSDAAKKIAKVLDVQDLDPIMQQLPAGEFKIG